VVLLEPTTRAVKKTRARQITQAEREGNPGYTEIAGSNSRDIPPDDEVGILQILLKLRWICLEGRKFEQRGA
jgi:hypothetical protein